MKLMLWVLVVAGTSAFAQQQQQEQQQMQKMQQFQPDGERKFTIPIEQWTDLSAGESVYIRCLAAARNSVPSAQMLDAELFCRMFLAQMPMEPISPEPYPIQPFDMPAIPGQPFVEPFNVDPAQPF